MKNIIWTLIVLTILSSCATQKRCNRLHPQVARVDSVYIETLKEVKIVTPGDTVNVEVPVIDCPDQELYLIENSKLKQQVRILNGKLISNTQIKPDTVTKYVTDTVIQYKEVKIPQVIKETPRFWKITGFVGIGAIIIMIALIALKMRSAGSFLKKLIG